MGEEEIRVSIGITVQKEVLPLQGMAAPAVVVVD